MLPHGVLYGSLSVLALIAAPASAHVADFGAPGAGPALEQNFQGGGGRHGGSHDRGPGRAGGRDHSGLDRYPGQNSYRSGRQPPEAQRRHDAQRGRDTVRHAYRADHRYQMRPYQRPHGWYRGDWGIGDILPSLFWGRDYWIDSYWNYDLPIPPAGCVWIRDGGDALLIDRQTGEIVSVIYDIFY